MTKVRNAIFGIVQSGMMKTEAAIVTEVSEDKRTISAKIDDELEIANIRITAVIADSENFIVHYPKIGSDVLIAEISQGAWLLISMSEIQKTHFKNDKFELVIEEGVVKVSTQEITINGGENKGLVKLEPLADVLTKITSWMRNIDAVIRNTQVVSGAVGSPDTFQIALKAAVTANNVPRVPDLENPKVKH